MWLTRLAVGTFLIAVVPVLFACILGKNAHLKFLAFSNVMLYFSFGPIS